MPPIELPLKDAKFSLNAWGVAGIFGGEESVSAMALIPLFQGRRWLGWYNAPGSLDVARHFGSLAQSHFWQRLFPNTTKSPATLFGFDGKVGPKYTGALSGTEMQTGHLGHLAIESCKEFDEVTQIPGRPPTTPGHVALIDLGTVDYDHNVPRLSRSSVFLALIPLVVSIVACFMCALVHDWYNFFVILLGIIANGSASLVIGSGNLTLMSVKQPAPGSPRGDGILVPVVWEDIVVVVKGAENAVNAITKGKFGFECGGQIAQHAIGVCSLLLISQFLSQLLLIPQGTLFGQVMFISSLCVSWVYTYAISSIRRESLLANVLFRKLGDPHVHKFHLGTRASLTAFVAFLVFHRLSQPTPATVQKTLATLIPNDTAVWERWRKRVAQQVCDESKSHLEMGEDEKSLGDSEKRLLTVLLDDAKAARAGYLGWAATLPPTVTPSPPSTHHDHDRRPLLAPIFGRSIPFFAGRSRSPKTLHDA